MRRVRDRHLPEPFRAWIDRDAPLPPGVTVLPRTIDVWGNAFGLVQVGMGCVGLGALYVYVIARAVTLTEAGSLTFLALCGGLLLVLLVWFSRRLWSEIGASRDRKAGRLRQGVLIGPEGVLVRLTPDRCYPVPMDHFVRAEEWTNGTEDSATYVRIVTRDGPVDFADADFKADAAELNRIVAAARSHHATGR